ncbi:low temperature requirement protein A [Microbulbifer sp. SAOS-129_SWC]|uniref:low temperature requirement protein A n=1 Tax=Microbulbifer sp. SAOS-129_SWC TaxID=3145235 RepID=UPI0032165933
MFSGFSASLFRVKGSAREHKVDFVELFFDLVFVYAITQTTHLLIASPGLAGVYRFFLILLSVWWVWVFTAWVTNWLDPQKVPVKLLLFALMFAGMLMAIAIPHAFDQAAWLFAASYLFMQLGRTLFMCLASRRERPAVHGTFVRMALWFGLSAALWIGGAAADGSARLLWWSAAVLVEYTSAMVSFHIPLLERFTGLVPSRSGDWDISGEHMAERCGLLVIIALGESLLVSGSTFAGLDWSPATVKAFVSAFVATVAMWWIYFNLAVEHANEEIAAAENTGAVGRLVYTYVHLLIIAGIVVVAAADEFVLAHPSGHTPARVVWAAIGGAVLYLGGNLLFKWLIFRSHPRSHYVGILLLLLLIPGGLFLPPLALGVLSSAILVLVGVWETVAVTAARRSETAVR